MTLLIVSCRAWRTEDGDCEVTIQSLSLWLENQGSMTKPSILYPETLNGSLEGFCTVFKEGDQSTVSWIKGFAARVCTPVVTEQVYFEV